MSSTNSKHLSFLLGYSQINIVSAFNRRKLIHKIIWIFLHGQCKLWKSFLHFHLGHCIFWFILIHNLQNNIMCLSWWPVLLASEAWLSLFSWATSWKASPNCIIGFLFFFTAFAFFYPCSVVKAKASFSFAGCLLAKSDVRASSSPNITMCAWFLIFHIMIAIAFLSIPLRRFWVSHVWNFDLLNNIFCFSHCDFIKILWCCHFNNWSLFHLPNVGSHYKIRSRIVSSLVTECHDGGFMQLWWW